jgi:predicted XRE-type DNA-binding protein
MKKNSKHVVTRNSSELAQALGLSPADAIEMDVRRQINDKIVRAVADAGLTHAEVAKAAGTSRTRVTAILNRNTSQISTDLMLRILASLGYRTRVSFTRTRAA